MLYSKISKIYIKYFSIFYVNREKMPQQGHIFSLKSKHVIPEMYSLQGITMV